MASVLAAPQILAVRFRQAHVRLITHSSQSHKINSTQNKKADRIIEAAGVAESGLTSV